MNANAEIIYCHTCNGLFVVDGDRFRACQDHALDEHLETFGDCTFTVVGERQ
ncbi:MAG: hypothetical protein ACXV5Q_01300 [Frankiaceae bacterium]